MPGAILWIGLGIALIAFNLRPALASVSPLLGQLADAFHLSDALAGALTTIPVLCFGLMAPLAPVLARRFGVEPTLLVSLIAIAGGIVLRLGPSALTLLAGTVIAGVGIALTNVLLPALVKRDFPSHAGLATGLYTTALAIGAALAAGATLPLEHAIGRGWRGGIGFWALPAVVAAVIWLPRLRSFPRNGGIGAGARYAAILRDPLAWQVVMLFGLQSLDYYVTLSWLPSIFREHHFDPATSGILLSISMVLGIPMSLAIPVLAARSRDQRVYLLGLIACTALGFLGILVWPEQTAYVSVALLGIGLGGTFPLALTLVVLRTRRPEQTEVLSSFAQCAGYLVAAIGPVLIGALHEATGGWMAPLALLLVLLVPETLGGLAVARGGRYLEAAG